MEIKDCSPGGIWVLGFFDGVHRGHRALIRAAREMLCDPSERERRCGEEYAAKKDTGGRFVGVWSFRTLPKTQKLLTTPEEREKLLREAGADVVHYADFAAVHAMTGETFFRHELCEKLRPAGIVCGFNFRFGCGGQSTAADLAAWCDTAGIPVRILPALREDGEVISSTWIRRLIAAGDTEKAASLLTYPYTIRGIVEHGKHLGHTLGFPTVNLRLEAGKTAPKCGIYAAQVRFPDGAGISVLPGVCNIGSRPTVNQDTRDVTVETYIIGCDANLYGVPIAVSLYQYLRGEIRFASTEALSAQIARDAAAAEQYFRTK